MTNDPIINAIGIKFKRFMLFWLLVGVLSVCLWFVLLHSGYDYPFETIWWATKVMWFEPKHRNILVLFSLCFSISFLSILVLYLVTALWWRKRGAIHHRGARIVDLREQER